MRRRYVAALAAVASVLFAVPAALGVDGGVAGEVASVKERGVPGAYVVQLAEKPVVTYDGGVAGIPATKPAKGQKIDPEAQNVKNYVKHLDARHDAVLASVGGGQKIHDYRYAYNGFAAKLSSAQVERLEQMNAVLSVEPVMEWAPDTSDTPRFLGLTGPGNLWAQLGGPQTGTNSANATGAGEGVVVGVLDTGIWPEHPSVSDRVDGKLMYKNLNSFHGKCASTETVTDGSWDANLCSQKLVGARFFIETFEAFGTVLAPNDYRSPRDSDGHGTHTSTTAAGNHNITPTGASAGFGNISGIAPRARIAMYKVCWDDGNPATGGCFTSDSAAAIDQAVADGVDVINFSISGTSTSFLNVVEVAAFNAAAAGVFVAMSAGNTGPGASTVNHPSPWLTTVGASTHDRPAEGVVELGNGATFTGVSQIKTTVGFVPVIRAQDAGLPGANPNLLRQCFSAHEPLGGNQATLDPALVSGKIVVCERGGLAPANARVDKSRAVFDAGGVGMILINVAAGLTLNADFHFVPTVHLPDTALAPIQGYAQTAGATAQLRQGSTAPVAAPFMAASSSRGPSAASGDQLKPDVTAPGVDVLAGYSPASLLFPGFLFNVVSGTSMSSPHVAGMGALLKHKHPTWTPAMIKSALMTTGSDVLGTFPSNAVGSADANRAFAQGAGHVRPTLAANPGLVYDNGPVDWLRFMCGTGQLAASECAPFGGAIDPSDLNLASIAIGDLAGTQTVKRTVKSVATSPQTYNVTFSGLPGITASVDTANFTVGPGGTQLLNITFTRSGAALNTYQAGYMTLTSANHVVRSPIVIRPVPLAAPLDVTLDGSNAATWEIKSGIGPESISLGKRGLIPAATDAVTGLADDPTNTFNTAAPDSNQGTFVKVINVPAGTSVLRGATFDTDTDGNDDLDLYLYRVNPDTTLTLVAASAGPTSEEVVTFRNPTAPRTYRLYVHAFATDGPDVNFTLFNWVLGTADAGNMTVNGPFAANIGSTHTVNLTTSGLTAGTRYLGQITYTGSVSGLIPAPMTVVMGKAS